VPIEPLNEYDLFLDESGTFLESSTAPLDQVATSPRSRSFPSQLAGLLVPRGAMTEGSAKELRNQALASIGLTSQPVHGSELVQSVGRDRYGQFVAHLANELRSRGWQAVRLVNRERISYGDRIATYTNLVAELVLRICHQKLKEGQRRIALRLCCARVKLGEQANGTIHFLEREEYLSRVTEYLSFIAVRRGLPQESSLWRVNELSLRSGKDDAQLQLCDIISHASHDDFRPSDPSAKASLTAVFAQYDFGLVFRELLDRVDAYLADGSLALGIISLAERLTQGTVEPDLAEGARRRVGEILDTLASRGCPARDPHLAILVTWLEQVIELQRLPETGYRLTRWLQAEVNKPLKERLEGTEDAPTLDWFTYALHTWGLTASNHRGALEDARRDAEELKQLAPSLAGQWEHASLLLRGMVAESVHLTDCFDHSAASSRMELVVSYYAQLGDLFQAALPTVFPDRIRSDLCGRALGTWLQSEIFAGLQDPRRLPAARDLSDRAIDEFTSERDKARQYQYRCHLETAAGCYPEARTYLALSLGVVDTSHASISASITRIGETRSGDQGFPLLHWLRIGATAVLNRVEEEQEKFLATIADSSILDSPWCRGEATTEYPVHGILRYAAITRTARDESTAALTLLTRLHELTRQGQTRRVILRAVQLAAHAEVGTMLWERGRAKQARALLESGVPKLPSLRELLPDFERETREPFPLLWRVFAPWSETLSKGLGIGAPAEAARETLRRMASAIGY
jgi:hypothetical protein